jgi:ADP-ribosylglycohydrolase
MESPPAGEKLARARGSLEGLSVGDAFGQRFFISPEVANSLIENRVLPEPPWQYTDDTEMALSVYLTLRESGEIDQDRLADGFALRYNPRRGYGPSMHGLLADFRLGVPWHVAAPELFRGGGSFGNGAAMRVAPVGAYFADDLDAVVLHAERSAVVTHTHPEAAAGAIAVAVAAAYASRLRDARSKASATASLHPDAAVRPDPPEFLDLILPWVPESLVREGIRHARGLAPECSVREAVAALGNGREISAQDTVPFTLWCAAQHLEDYEAALWLAVSGLGDRDTTCAIVGGIVALFTGIDGIPAEWRHARELLPDSIER